MLLKIRVDIKYILTKYAQLEKKTCTLKKNAQQNEQMDEGNTNIIYPQIIQKKIVNNLITTTKNMGI